MPYDTKTHVPCLEVHSYVGTALGEADIDAGMGCAMSCHDFDITFSCLHPHFRFFFSHFLVPNAMPNASASAIACMYVLQCVVHVMAMIVAGAVRLFVLNLELKCMALKDAWSDVDTILVDG
jgi:hypothetical protein